MIRERLILVDMTDPQRQGYFGEMILLKFPFRIGRRETEHDELESLPPLKAVDLAITETTTPYWLSRNHLEIGFVSGQPYLRDLGSATGILANGSKFGGNRSPETLMLEAPETELILGHRDSPWRFKLIIPRDEARPKLLVADDDEAMRQLVHRIFDRTYDLIEADDGLKALQLCQEKMPDIVLLDWRMPKLEGVSVCKTLKRDFRTSCIPVVMVTGLDSAESLTAGIEAGADDYITKPFESSMLRSRINGVLSRNHRQRYTHWLSGLPSETAFRQEVEKLLANPPVAKNYEILLVSVHHAGAVEKNSGADVLNQLLLEVAATVWDEALRQKFTLAAQLGLNTWGIVTPADRRKPIQSAIEQSLAEVLAGTGIKLQWRNRAADRIISYFDLLDL